MITLNDFRYMRCGKQLADLRKEDTSLLEPIHQYGSSKNRALLLLHGFGSSPAVFRYLLPQLKNYDALVCPALPGHAQSIKDFAQAKAKDWILCATNECATLFQDYKKVDILGLSLGALLACKLSLEFSFNHMFLLAPALKLQMNINKNLYLLKILKSLGFCELRANSGNITNKEHGEISYRRLPISQLIELFTLIREFKESSPNCPTHLFLGSHDIVVASKHIEKQMMHLPNVTTHWLLNSAHLLPLDNDLEEIVCCMNQCS